MAARNKPAGIRSLVYGMGKGKDGIEGLGVSLHREFLALGPLSLKSRAEWTTGSPLLPSPVDKVVS